MKTLENNKTLNISFIQNPALEFIYAVYDVALVDYLVNECAKDYNVTPDKEIIETVLNMKSKLSRYLKSELEYFFDSYEGADGGIAYIAYWTVVIKNPYVITVDELLKCIEETDENLLLSYVVSLIVSKASNKSIKDLCCWSDVQYDSNKMLELVKATNIGNEAFKDKFIEALENPLETKERLYLMLKQFYEKIYKPIEQKNLETLEIYKERYEKLFEKNPEKFVRQFLNTSLKSLTEKGFLHISYFQYIGCCSWSNVTETITWFNLGAYANTFATDTIAKDKILLFYKTLSDQKRLDIINLLSIRPWYVYELADELSMSAATISYHLGLLQSLDIVQYERCDHRIYYSLDKEKLKEFSEKAVMSLLNQ